MSDKDFVQAKHSLIDPLIEPDPSDETGLNAHFSSTFAPRPRVSPPSPPKSAGLEFAAHGVHPQHTGSTTSTKETNPYRRSRAASMTKSPASVTFEDGRPSGSHSYPSPPSSASPRRERFSTSTHGDEAFVPVQNSRRRRSSQPSSAFEPAVQTRRNRSGSLRERFPGDMSHRPLDTIRKDNHNANRAYHLRKKNLQGADVIDRMDMTGFALNHHEGPYDAANKARNMHEKFSPVAAVRDSNEEALKATPRENIVDSITKHRPLDGVAIVPPGVPDDFGRVFDYQEGTDLMREPGADYKRWPGVVYHPDDLKGKGEPSFSADRALKDRKRLGDSGTELSSRRRNQSMGTQASPLMDFPQESLGIGTGVARSHSTGGRSVGNVLKQKFGSLRRRKVDT